MRWISIIVWARAKSLPGLGSNQLPTVGLFMQTIGRFVKSLGRSIPYSDLPGGQKASSKSRL
jgi:hypothetical protein